MDKTDQGAGEIEHLYRRYGAALLLFASAIAGDRGRAQDAVHQVFLKLIESGDISKAADKKAFLFACVRNAILNDSKVQRRNAPFDAESIWFQPPDRDYAEERNLRRALHALPDDQREVIVLHLWGELTFAEIGELAGISANTAASRYRYALAKLRHVLSHKEDSVQSSDDKQFERYLKRFQPLVPDPIPVTKSRQRFSSLFAPVAWIGASAAILIAGFVVFHTRNGQVASRTPVEPLTIATANSWLADAPSFQTALDELALRAKLNPFLPDKQSAIAVLSEERTKL